MFYLFSLCKRKSMINRIIIFGFCLLIGNTSVYGQPITKNKKQKHAGSTLLAIDIDNDNDKDLILGDISYNNLNFVFIM